MSANPLRKAAGRQPGFDGRRPDIINGAINNDIAEVRAALAINPRDIVRTDVVRRMTALHWAAGLGNLSMVEFLLAQPNVRVRARDIWDRDPLDVAITSGNQDVVTALFRFRARMLERHQD